MHGGGEPAVLDSYADAYRSAIVGLRDGTLTVDDGDEWETLNDAIRKETESDA